VRSKIDLERYYRNNYIFRESFLYELRSHYLRYRTEIKISHGKLRNNEFSRADRRNVVRKWDQHSKL